MTLAIDLAKLPLFPGIEQIDISRFRTRASKTNMEYVAPHTRLEGGVNRHLLEFFYDAQTSGGLLISVPAEKAAALESELKARGTTCAAIIGEVREFDGAYLSVR